MVTDKVAKIPKFGDIFVKYHNDLIENFFIDVFTK